MRKIIVIVCRLKPYSNRNSWFFHYSGGRFAPIHYQWANGWGVPKLSWNLIYRNLRKKKWVYFGMSMNDEDTNNNQ